MVCLSRVYAGVDGLQAAAFEGFGELSSATVVLDEDDQSRGFGFVVPPCPPARHIHLHCLAVSAVPMVPSAYAESLPRMLHVSYVLPGVWVCSGVRRAGGRRRCDRGNGWCGAERARYLCAPIG